MASVGMIAVSSLTGMLLNSEKRLFAAVKHCAKLRTNLGYRISTGRILLHGWSPVSELGAGHKIYNLYLTTNSPLMTGQLHKHKVPIQACLMDSIGGWTT